MFGDGSEQKSNTPRNAHTTPELCESGGGRPGALSLISLMVSVDVNTMKEEATP